MAILKSFEELDCWKVSTELRREIFILVKSFPPDEKYELVSRMRRAARSATNNLAEGFGRYHYQEYIRFCRISRASLNELQDHLIIAQDEGYLSMTQLADLKSKIGKAISLINGFIKYLEERKKRTKNLEEPNVEYCSHAARSTTFQLITD